MIAASTTRTADLEPSRGPRRLFNGDDRDAASPPSSILGHPRRCRSPTSASAHRPDASLRNALNRAACWKSASPRYWSLAAASWKWWPAAAVYCRLSTTCSSTSSVRAAETNSPRAPAIGVGIDEGRRYHTTGEQDARERSEWRPPTQSSLGRGFPVPVLSRASAHTRHQNRCFSSKAAVRLLGYSGGFEGVGLRPMHFQSGHLPVLEGDQVDKRELNRESGVPSASAESIGNDQVVPVVDELRRLQASPR